MPIHTASDLGLTEIIGWEYVLGNEVLSLWRAWSDLLNLVLHCDVTDAVLAVFLTRMFIPFVRRTVARRIKGDPHPIDADIAEIPLWPVSLTLPTWWYLATPFYLAFLTILLTGFGYGSIPQAWLLWPAIARWVAIGVFACLELFPFVLAAKDLLLSIPIGALVFNQSQWWLSRWYVRGTVPVTAWEMGSQADQLILSIGARRCELSLNAPWSVAALKAGEVLVLMTRQIGRAPLIETPQENSRQR